ncbi:MAG: PAS domain S-box protein, partial [Exiguobacterium indicum]
MDRSTIDSYEVVIQEFPLPAFILNTDLTIRSWNELAAQQWGWTQQEVVGQIVPLLEREDMAFSQQIWHAFLERRQSVQLPNASLLHKTGTSVTSTLLLSPLLDDTGTVIAAFACCIPSAEQQTNMKPLFQGLMDLRHAFDQIASVAVFDARGTITYVNDQLIDVTGYCSEMLLNQPWSLILDPSSSVVSEIRAQLRERKAWSGRLSLTSQTGERKHLQATLIPIYDANGVRFQHLFIGNDITETTALEEELDFLVHHHEMTHLLNKRGFLREGESLFRSAGSHDPVALILFDIDRFKVINDSFGTHV